MVAANRFLPSDEVGLRRLAEANGVNVSYPPQELTTVAADRFLTLDEVGLRRLVERERG